MGPGCSRVKPDVQYIGGLVIVSRVITKKVFNTKIKPRLNSAFLYMPGRAFEQVQCVRVQLSRFLVYE